MPVTALWVSLPPDQDPALPLQMAPDSQGAARQTLEPAAPRVDLGQHLEQLGRQTTAPRVLDALLRLPVVQTVRYATARAITSNGASVSNQIRQLAAP